MMITKQRTVANDALTRADGQKIYQLSESLHLLMSPAQGMVLYQYEAD